MCSLQMTLIKSFIANASWLDLCQLQQLVETEFDARDSHVESACQVLLNNKVKSSFTLVTLLDHGGEPIVKIASLPFVGFFQEDEFRYRRIDSDMHVLSISDIESHKFRVDMEPAEREEVIRLCKMDIAKIAGDIFAQLKSKTYEELKQ